MGVCGEGVRGVGGVGWGCGTQGVPIRKYANLSMVYMYITL